MAGRRTDLLDSNIKILKKLKHFWEMFNSSMFTGVLKALKCFGFLFPLQGCVVTVTGRLTFVSNKSMEIEVLVDASSLVQEDKGKYRAVSAFFTFISLDKENKPLPVPPLKVGPIQALFSFIKHEHGFIWSHFRSTLCSMQTAYIYTDLTQI